MKATGLECATNPAASLRDLLLARGFKRKDAMLLEVVASSQAKHRYADAVTGFYFLKCKDDDDRPCYQRVKLSTSRQGASVLVGMDMYLCWHGPNARWEFTCMKIGKACFAFSTEQISDPCGIGSWRLLRDNFGKAEAQAETRGVGAGCSVVATPPEPSPKKRRLDSHGTQGDSAVDTSSKQTPPEGASTSESAAKVKRTQDDSTKKAAKQTTDIPCPVGVTPTDSSFSDASSPSAISPANDPVNRDMPGKGDGAIHMEKVYFWEDVEGQREHIEPSPPPQEVPSHWPAGVRIDPGKWQPWLPKDWGQGLKTQPRGDDVKVYVSPSGSLCYAKAAVEKKVGELFESPAPDVEWPSWLPKNWAISKRQKVDGQLVKIYIAPGGDRYFNSKPEVEKFVSGKTGKQRTGSDGRLIGRLYFAQDVEMRLKALASA